MFVGKKQKKTEDIPTTSLPDIVFLLLIFFLVTSTIDTEKGLDLVLPEPNVSELKMAKSNIANILINAAGQVALDGQIIDVAEITNIIKDKLQNNPLLVASVKTDKNTQYEIYIDVLDRLKKAWGDRPTRISIAEPEEN
jgi:biopolymer transport protein ExbD